MNRTITVKGQGYATVAPDQIEVSLSIKAKDDIYEQTIQLAAAQLESLQKTIVLAGFQKEDLKTSNFEIDTVYISQKDRNGDYHQRFDGYACRQSLRIVFDKDMELLGELLSKLSRCIAEPEFSIRFTIKDKMAVSNALLQSAVANAKEKATVLVGAAGASLGSLLSIDYNWGELSLYSHTDYAMENAPMMADGFKCMEIEPEDIQVRDTVTLVWELQ